MKLSTYNFLTSRSLKNVVNGYPLKLKIIQKDVKEIDFNSRFIENLLPKLDWEAVRLAAEAVEMLDEIPLEKPAGAELNDEVLKKLHHLLLEVNVLEGELECPETGRIFPIQNGIPNMLVNEMEV